VPSNLTNQRIFSSVGSASPSRVFFPINYSAALLKLLLAASRAARASASMISG
jgi:hypothetical protein